MRPEGPGGIPEGAILTRTEEAVWQPPAPIGVNENDGKHIGQVAGEPTFAKHTLHDIQL